MRGFAGRGSSAATLYRGGYWGVMSDDDQNRQRIVIVGLLKGHTSIDDRIIYLVNVPGYIEWFSDDGGD